MSAPIKPKARADLATVVLDGEAVIYDSENEELHHLNQTATLVLAMCEGQATIREIAAEISQAFGVPEAEVEPQVRTLLRDLRKAKLLEPSRNGMRKHG